VWGDDHLDTSKLTFTSLLVTRAGAPTTRRNNW
jgi:hypothetical protein